MAKPSFKPLWIRFYFSSSLLFLFFVVLPELEACKSLSLDFCHLHDTDELDPIIWNLILVSGSVNPSVKEENAAGTDIEYRQGVSEEAYLITRHSLLKKSA